MAQSPADRPENNIGFQQIELLKKQTLGVGSYGSVCKAKCDNLIVAAKIIHPTLVSPNERQQISPQRMHRLPSARFETECDFLRDIKHPNIIQFLGMTTDPETGLPVLLMELMDESLTHFLESSAEPIPYHIQVAISQDISAALSFLHLNGIIHRDLSSNNILLIGKGVRAKITDFGMAKLVNIHMTRVSNTVCPGTDVYMPPEAVNNQAVYTEKGDVFSFGVNIVQVVTKKFPKPEDRFQTIRDPRFPTGSLRVCTPEVERRNNHISQIAPAHPLLPIALDCLKDQEGERPSVSDLCQRLAALNDTHEYRESENRQRTQQALAPVLHQQIQQAQRILAEKDRQLADVSTQRDQLCAERDQLREEGDQLRAERDQLREEGDQLRAEGDQLRSEGDQLRAERDQLCAERDQLPAEKDQLCAERVSEYKTTVRDNEREELVTQLEEKDQLIAAKDLQLTSKEQVFERLQKEGFQTQELLTKLSTEVDHLRSQLKSKQHELEHSQQALTGRQENQDLVEELRTAQATIRERNQKLRDHEEMIGQFQTRINKLELLSRPQPHAQPLSSTNTATPQHQPTLGTPSTRREAIRLNWTDGTKAPCEMHKNTDAVVGGDVMYFNPGGTRKVYSFITTTNTWAELPDCLIAYTTLAIVNGYLTTIGGGIRSGYTNKLISLMGEGWNRRWVGEFPPMPTERCFVTAVSTARALIVAGGGRGSDLTKVEIMNLNTLQWCTAADLPKPMSCASASVCGDHIYMSRYNSVITCSLSVLLQSCRYHDAWSTVADLPVQRSTLVSINNHLIAIGGCDSTINPTRDVHTYDPDNNSWLTISHLNTPRQRCFSVVLPVNKIIVVGGFTSQLIDSKTDAVEVGNVV